MKLTRTLGGLTALALVAAACGGGGDDTADSTAAPTSTSSTTTTVKATTTTSSSSTSTTSTTVPATIRQPLTGQPLESVDEILLRPAMAVKIDNNPVSARNHSGLAVADIVFEMIVEGRTTRFAAVFHSQSSAPIGPIRSGRTQDVDLLSSFNEPLFVWSGGNGGVTRAINDSFLINMGPNDADGYYRGPGSAPYNLYNDTDTIWFQTPEGHPGSPPQQFQYLEVDEEFAGAATAGVRARIGAERIEWTWNPEFNQFDRTQRGQPHEDSLFGRIRATNVVVLGVPYQPSVVDRNSPDAQTLGEGPVWIFTDGKVVEGTWKRELAIFPIEYFDAAGAPIRIAPGNTWVELADLDDVADGAIEILPPSTP